mmetsp:Transcript_71087/g.141246  ORF Transcript_71087/g.141246 Transcript_71087/m.141246 type:complete len:241 (+) Transcript_71087:72-794(+)
MAGAGGDVQASSPPRIVALIPARGGSVSIPLKNIKELDGRPLIDWTIQAALASGCFKDVYVSTDHEGIAAVAERSGARVHWRDPETATSTASTELAMVDFAKKQPDFDVLCLVQATSPLTTPQHFQEAVAQFNKFSADSLVTAVRAHRFMWCVDPVTGEAKAKNYNPESRPRRQDWDGELIENGAFYLTSKSLFDRTSCRLGGKMVLYEMPEHTLTELDSSVDWEIMEGLCKQHGYKLSS